ncbi:MAG: PQQ-dependent sugar dehydrogenase [Gammaproteobacteria bacterium]|nr:PQQ-dependent sugar dehydrogenase [Gammaproteobacteria bacterium]
MSPLNSARLFVFGFDNEMIVGTKSSRIYRLKQPYNKVELLAIVPNSRAVHSVVFKDGYLYAADSCGIWRSRYSINTKPDFKKHIELPCATGGHYTRTLAVGSDNKLYVSLGISGNCSDEYLDNSYLFQLRRGGIYRIDENSKSEKPTLIPYASGLRNPIGLAFSPDGTLYATNAGSDNMGYELPPEVLAKTSEHSFHGMPWFQYYGGKFQSGMCAQSPPPRSANEATLPAATFAARSTPIGIDFLTQDIADNIKKGDALVAIHGSWGTPPGGGSSSRRPPKILIVKFKDNKVIDVKDLITGFQRPDGSRFARPVGVRQGQDGNIYFTSDGGDLQGIFKININTPYKSK